MGKQTDLEMNYCLWHRS